MQSDKRKIQRDIRGLMNPGIYGAVATIVDQKIKSHKYKNDYIKYYGKHDKQIVWSVHISDLKKKASDFLIKLHMLQRRTAFCVYKR